MATQQSNLSAVDSLNDKEKFDSMWIDGYDTRKKETKRVGSKVIVSNNKKTGSH